MRDFGSIEPPLPPPVPPPPAAVRIDAVEVKPSGPFEKGQSFTVVAIGTAGGTAWWTLEVIPPTPAIGER